MNNLKLLSLISIFSLYASTKLDLSRLNYEVAKADKELAECEKESKRLPQPSAAALAEMAKFAKERDALNKSVQATLEKTAALTRKM